MSGIQDEPPTQFDINGLTPETSGKITAFQESLNNLHEAIKQNKQKVSVYIQTVKEGLLGINRKIAAIKDIIQRLTDKITELSKTQVSSENIQNLINEKARLLGIVDQVNQKLVQWTQELESDKTTLDTEKVRLDEDITTANQFLDGIIAANASTNSAARGGRKRKTKKARTNRTKMSKTKKTKMKTKTKTRSKSVMKRSNAMKKQKGGYIYEHKKGRNSDSTKESMPSSNSRARSSSRARSHK